MEKTNKRKPKVRFNMTRLLLTVVVVVLVVVFSISAKNIIDLKIEQNQLKKENKELRAQKKKLEEELEQINDENYIEEQARKQLNMVKPGEILYILESENEEEDE